MTKIFKYPLAILGLQTVHIQEGFLATSLLVQNDFPVLYAMVDTEDKYVDAEVRTFGTGEAIPEDYDGNFVGTYQLSNGFVGHVFIQY